MLNAIGKFLIMTAECLRQTAAFFSSPVPTEDQSMRYVPTLAATLIFAEVVLNSPSTASAQGQPGMVVQLPAAYRFMVGSTRVTALSDGTVPLDLHQLLRGTTSAKTDALLKQSFMANPVEASINAFLVEMGSRRILVDAGSGILFGPGNGGKLLGNLAAAGVQPSEITDILITHVHTDHSGGLMVDGRIAFPGATVHVGKPDVDFFLDRENAVRAKIDVRYFDEAIATLKPYVDAGQVKSFSGATEVLPGISAELHPGHTPGTAFYTLQSKGEKIVFIGDIIHVAQVQFASPDVAIAFDVDSKSAVKVRQMAFATFAADGALIAAPHLPFPGVGHVRRSQPGYQWVPMNYTNRDASGAKPSY